MSEERALPVDVLRHILEHQPFCYPQLAKLRLVSKQLKAFIDAYPRAKALRLRALVLFRFAIQERNNWKSYHRLKGMRAVSKDFKELIETSTKFDEMLFREVPLPIHRSIRRSWTHEHGFVDEYPPARKWHPALYGHFNLCADKLEEVSAFVMSKDDFLPLIDYSCKHEQATSPPVTRLTILEANEPTIENSAGVTVLEVAEAFAREMATPFISSVEGLVSTFGEQYREQFEREYCQTWLEMRGDHRFFEYFIDVHFNEQTGHLFARPRYGS